MTKTKATPHMRQRSTGTNPWGKPSKNNNNAERAKANSWKRYVLAHCKTTKS